MGIFAADRKGSIDEPRTAEYGSDTIRQRVAFYWITDKIGVEPAVVVFVVVGANSLGAGRQIIEHPRSTLGCRL